MILELLVAASSSGSCVALYAPASSPLTQRVKDELATVTGRPIVLPAAGESPCPTEVKLDETGKRLRVVALTHQTPVVFDEVLDVSVPSSAASHVAEVVRGVLLEVEIRDRPQPVAAVALTQPPSPPAARPALFEISVSCGALASGDLSPGLALQLDLGWRFWRWFSLNASVAATPIVPSLQVAEGRISILPVGGWLGVKGRVALSYRAEFLAGAGVGAWWFAASGEALLPFLSARAEHLTFAFVVEGRIRQDVAGGFGLFVGGATHFLPSRLSLDVANRPAATYGPVMVAIQGGVDTRW